MASIVFLILYRLIDKPGRRLEPWVIASVICLGTVAFTAAHIAFRFKLSTIPNGGWRETWGIFFFGAGLIYRRFEPSISRHWLAVSCFIFIGVAGWMRWSGMNNSGMYRDLITLPLTGFAGFTAVHYMSKLIAAHENRAARLLAFIGENTLYILLFHIISFKAVSLLKIWWYGLDPLQIGCHMVIHEHADDWFWTLYTLAGVAIPLTGLQIARRLPSLSRSFYFAFTRFFSTFASK